MRNAPTTDVLEAQPVSVRVKLAAAWTSLMFLFAYMDISPSTSPYNLDGETWTEFGGFFGLGVARELAVLAFIIRAAWTWPRTARAGSDAQASQPRRMALTA